MSEMDIVYIIVPAWIFVFDSLKAGDVGMVRIEMNAAMN